MKEKLVFCWSGGKDSALALNRVLNDDRYEIVSLLTTCNERRVPMHEVRLELLERQAASIGLPLEKIFLTEGASDEEYGRKMEAALRAHQAGGVTGCVFGDIFLEDLKLWREEKLAKVGLKAVFPLWKVDSRELMREFFALGFKSILTCTNETFFGDQAECAVGRVLDPAFIASLPPDIDPCGENGEYHSFVFDGPVFKEPVQFTVGAKTYRAVQKGDPHLSHAFWYCDLLPA